MAKTGFIEFKLNSQDSKNLTSTVTVYGKVTTSGDSYRGDTRTGEYLVWLSDGSKILQYLTGNGTTNSVIFTHGAPADSTTTLWQQTFVVQHDNNGKANYIFAEFDYDSNWAHAKNSYKPPDITPPANIRVKQDGKYKNGKTYVKHGGKYKECKVFVKSAGVYKQCGIK